LQCIPVCHSQPILKLSILCKDLELFLVTIFILKLAVCWSTHFIVYGKTRYSAAISKICVVTHLCINILWKVLHLNSICLCDFQPCVAGIWYVKTYKSVRISGIMAGALKLFSSSLCPEQFWDLSSVCREPFLQHVKLNIHLHLMLILGMWKVLHPFPYSWHSALHRVASHFCCTVHIFHIYNYSVWMSAGIFHKSLLQFPQFSIVREGRYVNSSLKWSWLLHSQLADCE
jgi:hypothetical protein